MVLFLSDQAYALHFEGEADLSQKSLTLTLNTQHKNTFIVNLESPQEDMYHLLINVSKFKTPLFDISTILEGEIEIKPSVDGKTLAAQGKIRTKYSLVNLKPIEEISLQFDYQEYKLTIHSLSAGFFKGTGYMYTIPPYDMDVSLDIADFPVNDILPFFAEGTETTSFNDVYGHIEIFGHDPSLHIKGKLSSYEGTIEDVWYDGLYLNFEGAYPLIEIANSTITQPDGMTFKIAGNLDLTDLENLDRQIRSFIKYPFVTFDDNQAAWTLKRINSDHRPGTTELKYLLRKNDQGHRSSDEESGMFGIERRMEF